MADIRALFFWIFISSTSFVVGQTCCSGGIPLSNNLGLSILKKGSFQFGLSYDYNYLNTLLVESDKITDNNRLRVTHSGLLNVGYAISDRLAIEGLFTWVNQRRNITYLESRNLDQSSGFGDSVLLLRYNMAQLFGSNVGLNIGLGTKIPLGSSNETNALGITLNADLQPGSNAWDLIYWSELSSSFNFRPTMTISARVVIRDTGVNNSYFGDTSYEFGNDIQSFVGISDQFVLGKSLLSSGVYFKYRKANKDQIGGFDLSNTGGNWISVIPSISINIRPALVFSTSIELPLYSEVDGTQLTPTFRLTTGITIQFASNNVFVN